MSIRPPAPAQEVTQVELDAHTTDAADAHDASAISFVPTGTVAATDVQAAIAEVASESGTSVAFGRPKTGATGDFSIPGITLSGVTGSAAPGANSWTYEQRLIEVATTIDQLAIEVVAAGAAGKKAVLGILSADTDWQPVAIIADAGEVAIDSTGVKTAAVAVTLQPGRYLFVHNNNSGAAQFRHYTGNPRTAAGIPPTMGANVHSTFYSGASAYAGGAPMILPPAWTNQYLPIHMVVCRVVP